MKTRCASIGVIEKNKLSLQSAEHVEMAALRVPLLHWPF